MPSPDWLFAGVNDREQDQLLDYQFGTWVRNRRNALALSYHETAQLGGMDPSRWIAIERGALKKAVTKTECEKIAKVFDLPVEFVVQKAVGA